jgi:hypothetical protein
VNISTGGLNDFSHRSLIACCDRNLISTLTPSGPMSNKKYIFYGIAGQAEKQRQMRDSTFAGWFPALNANQRHFGNYPNNWNSKRRLNFL